MKSWFSLIFLVLSLSTPWLAAAGSCAGDLAPPGPRKELRTAFIHEFADIILADEQQNQTWIDDALAALAGDTHIIVENSWIKMLNDKILKNKDLVTALTNYHKILFLEELKKTSLRLKFAPYQDFKSTRLTLAGAPSPEDLRQLEEAFTRAKKNFYSSPRVREIIRASDLKRSWFRMGVGKSEAQAALAARFARDNAGKTDMAYFWDHRVSKYLRAQLQEVQNLHRQISAQLGGSELMEKSRDGLSLKLEVFAAARKATPATFLATLHQLFPGSEISEKIAAQILRFTQISDEFSPSVLIAKRELLTIHNSPFGALSIDFIGLGAENLRATSKALVLAGNLNDAVVRTRANERWITEVFELRKLRVVDVVKMVFGDDASIRFSGDDGIIIPRREVTLGDQMQLMQRLAGLLPKPFFRLAIISPEGSASVDSSQLITHGESIEKTLRQMVLNTMGVRRADELSFGVFIPDVGSLRKVYLIMGAKRRLNPDEAEVLLNLFPGAVKTVQEQVQAQGLDIEYEGAEIFAIFKGR